MTYRHLFALCAWCIPLALVEIFLYVSYRGHDARFHWFTHFFVGASFALVLMSVAAWHFRRPIPLPLVWPVMGHLYAMFPDLLFNQGTAHSRWMDIFLAHLSSHFVPGRNLTWYVVFLLAFGFYLAVLARLAPASLSRGPDAAGTREASSSS